MIIKFEPHGFVVFLTLIMGMAFAISNSRSGWGFLKVVLTTTFVLPTLYYGIATGRFVEAALGAIIGWTYGRGLISLPYFKLIMLEWLRTWSSANQGKKEDTKKTWQRPNPEGDQKPCFDEEVRKRREQARNARENTDFGGKQSDSSTNDHNSFERDEEESERHQQEQATRVKSNRDSRSAHEILGVSPLATKAEIKRAYSLLRSRYHPDKYSHMSRFFVAEAEEELKKVNKAWGLLKDKN